jgi:hypothetical protein
MIWWRSGAEDLHEIYSQGGVYSPQVSFISLLSSYQVPVDEV